MILHFIFDWILQPRDIAKTKNTDIIRLLWHIIMNVTVYLILIFLVLILVISYRNNWQPLNNGQEVVILLYSFLGINIVSHALIDWYLPKLFKPEISERRMVNMVAVDQILHLGILFISINYIL